MAVQKVEVEHKGIKRWIVLIVGLGFALAYLLLQRTVPAFPYYHYDQVIYPLLLIARNGFFVLAIYLVVALIIVLGILRAKLTAIRLLVLVGLTILVSCSLVVTSTLFIPGFSQIDSIRYRQNVYHLGFSYGAERGFDYNLYVYIVYKCDSLGLICTNVDTPYREANLTAEVPEHDVSFVQQSSDSRLYVQVDGDLYPVPRNNPP